MGDLKKKIPCIETVHHILYSLKTCLVPFSFIFFNLSENPWHLISYADRLELENCLKKKSFAFFSCFYIYEIRMILYVVHWEIYVFNIGNHVKRMRM